jgi:polyisoprenoid-binding protein YceI
METTAASHSQETALPKGTWTVSPSASVLEFSARGMFGLVPVKGTFKDFEGELQVDDAGAHGELRVKAASLDTRNAKRDKHLRSSDFFDVEQSPTLTFKLTDAKAAPGGGATFSGSLKIRDNDLPISAPLDVSTHDDHLHLEASLAVDRAAAGVGWSKMGMIKGAAHLHAKLLLERQAQ